MISWFTSQVSKVATAAFCLPIDSNLSCAINLSAFSPGGIVYILRIFLLLNISLTHPTFFNIFYFHVSKSDKDGKFLSYQDFYWMQSEDSILFLCFCVELEIGNKIHFHRYWDLSRSTCGYFNSRAGLRSTERETFKTLKRSWVEILQYKYIKQFKIN